MAVTWKKVAYYDTLLTVEEQEIVGRLTGGNVDGITIGIADNNMVQIDDAAAADDEFARFTANGIEGLSAGDTRTALNVADGADVTGDNAPKAHTASHAVSGADTVFPADPDADRYLMWMMTLGN